MFKRHATVLPHEDATGANVGFVESEQWLVTPAVCVVSSGLGFIVQVAPAMEAHSPKEGWKLMLRCYNVTSVQSATQSFDGIPWPVTSIVSVGSQQVARPDHFDQSWRPEHRGKKHSIDITAYVVWQQQMHDRSAHTAGQAFTFRFGARVPSIVNHHTGYAFALQWERAYDVATVVKRLVEAPEEASHYQNYEECLVRMQGLLSFGDDDDLLLASATGTQSMSLLCPLSRARIEVPARGKMCRHIGCFDLATYLAIQRGAGGRATWVCPMCSQALPMGEIVLDTFVESVIKNTMKGRREIESVELFANGSWKVVDDAMLAPVSDGSLAAAGGAVLLGSKGPEKGRKGTYINGEPEIIDLTDPNLVVAPWVGNVKTEGVQESLDSRVRRQGAVRFSTEQEALKILEDHGAQGQSEYLQWLEDQSGLPHMMGALVEGLSDVTALTAVTDNEENVILSPSRNDIWAAEAASAPLSRSVVAAGAREAPLDVDAFDFASDTLPPPIPKVAKPPTGFSAHEAIEL